jgi:hypothetical protein
MMHHKPEIASSNQKILISSALPNNLHLTNHFSPRYDAANNRQTAHYCPTNHSRAKMHLQTKISMFEDASIIGISDKIGAE